MIMDRELLNKVEKRNREMLLDYPEIINKFTLLVGAGMSLSNAWAKISVDYKEKGRRKRYAYEEMMITYGELKIGTSETIAYERFGRRVRLLPYLRFSSLIAQNVKKGSSTLLSQLELEAVEAFEERKELAKRMGEEAGTKLLVPMMLMLLIVLAIIMVPAFLSFSL
jgi:pilus assembly protein TadC